MQIEIKEAASGPIEIVPYIPPAMRPRLLPGAVSFHFSSERFTALCQEFKGEGFSAWYSRYWIELPTVLSARSDLPAVELRIALKNKILGEWEMTEDPVLPAGHFYFNYVPHIKTRAVFEQAQEYQSFDIHFDIGFLQRLGIDYVLLDKFINKINKSEPAMLAPVPYRCPVLMLDAVNAILHNHFSPHARAALLHNAVSNILICALEICGQEEIARIPLSPADIEALHHVKYLIEKHCPEYLSNDVLVRKARPRLNAFKLSYGFKRLFSVNPYEYYQQLRFDMGKRLLMEGFSVSVVSADLEYDSATTFIKAFKKRFHITPKQFQKDGSGNLPGS